MINVQILENNDILQEDDWCRPLNITSMSGGMSDDYTFESFGRPINNAKWCAVAVSFPYWIGKCINDMPQSIRYHEFIRGIVPKQHIHPNGKETAEQQKLRFAFLEEE
jgi:hypothetical protein